MLGIFLATMTPLISLLLYDFVIALPKDSTIMIYKNGDNRSPCHIHLDISKKPIGDPLIKKKILVVEIHLTIRLFQ